MKDTEKSKKIPNGLISYPLVGTAMLALLLGKATEGGYTLANTIPAIVCFVSLWALFFSAKSKINTAL
ncbi:hypothetical protein [Colwellia sp. MEBiC06753]